MNDRELDQLHEKLDKLAEKMDNIIDMLRDHHGRLKTLEAFSGMVKVGLTLMFPAIIKIIYDIAKSL
jgi:hypothetical protein